MSGHASRYLDLLRKPEYTGENRCVPCTMLNVVIALSVSLLLSLVAVELAAVVLVASLFAIYLRGYLVPGTPRLTDRYLPNRLLARFDSHPLEEERADERRWETLEKVERERRNAVDPEQFLADADVIGPCDDGDGRCLTEEFATLAERQMNVHRDEPMDRGILAEMFDVEPGDIESLDRDYPAVKIGFRVRKWPSEGALVADIATHEALCERTDRWGEVPFELRQRMLESLRGFHGTCPLCSGEIRYSDDVVESCCGQYEVTRVACVDCDERLLEFDPSTVGTDANIKGFTP